MTILEAIQKPLRFRHPLMRVGMYYRVSGNFLVRSSDANPIEVPASLSLADLQASDYEFEAAEKEEVRLSREKLAEVARTLNLTAEEEAAAAEAMGFQPEA